MYCGHLILVASVSQILDNLHVYGFVLVAIPDVVVVHLLLFVVVHLLLFVVVRVCAGVAPRFRVYVVVVGGRLRSLHVRHRPRGAGQVDHVRVGVGCRRGEASDGDRHAGSGGGDGGGRSAQTQ